jgi:uncharacterized RmlC-like cupin family protein
MPAGPATEAMTRTLAAVDETISAVAARSAPQTISGWHHHGSHTTCVYVVRGRTRIEWGPGGRESAEVSAGDFYVISPNTIHREGNPGSEDQVIVGFQLGSGPVVVNVLRPEPA